MSVVMQARCFAQVVWIARHRHIGDAFFDADAAQFLQEQLHYSRGEQVRCCANVSVCVAWVDTPLHAADAHTICLLCKQQ